MGDGNFLFVKLFASWEGKLMRELKEVLIALLIALNRFQSNIEDNRQHTKIS